MRRDVTASALAFLHHVVIRPTRGVVTSDLNLLRAFHLGRHAFSVNQALRLAAQARREGENRRHNARQQRDQSGQQPQKPCSGVEVGANPAHLQGYRRGRLRTGQAGVGVGVDDEHVGARLVTLPVERDLFAAGDALPRVEILEQWHLLLVNLGVARLGSGGLLGGQLRPGVGTGDARVLLPGNPAFGVGRAGEGNADVVAARRLNLHGIVDQRQHTGVGDRVASGEARFGARPGVVVPP